MKNDDQLLEASIQALKSLRTEVHGKVGNSVVKRIDKIIRDLERAKKTGKCQYSAIELLKLLAFGIEQFPAIEKAIGQLIQLIK